MKDELRNRIMELREIWISYRDYVGAPERGNEPISVRKRAAFINRALKYTDYKECEIAEATPMGRCTMYHARKKHGEYSSKKYNISYYDVYKKCYKIAGDFLEDLNKPEENIYTRYFKSTEALRNSQSENELLKTQIKDLNLKIDSLINALKIEKDTKGVQLKHIFSATDYAKNIGWSRTKIHGKIKRDGVPYFKTKSDGKQSFFVYDTTRVNKNFESNIFISKFK